MAFCLAAATCSSTAAQLPGTNDHGMGAPVCMQGLKRGLRLIDAAMAELKGTPAERQVSTADMIALAGAYAVSKTGGPKIEVPVGECFTRCCRRFKWGALVRPPRQVVDYICGWHLAEAVLVVGPWGRILAEAVLVVGFWGRILAEAVLVVGPPGAHPG